MSHTESPTPRPLKLAVLASVFYTHSHADVIVSRWIEPRPHDHEKGWSKPPHEIVSIYLDQCPPTDIGLGIVGAAGIPVYPTMRDALTHGTDSIAVDGIIVIVEHGDFPQTVDAQKAYPKARFFEQLCLTMESCGKGLPLFFDKHFGLNGAEAAYWINRLKRSGARITAGSSTSDCGWTITPETPPAANITSYCALCYESFEAYWFHSIESTMHLISGINGRMPAPIRAIRSWKTIVPAHLDSKENFPTELADLAWEVKQSGTSRSEDCHRSPMAALYEMKHADGMTGHVVYYRSAPGFALAVTDGVNKWGAIPKTHGEDKFFYHFAALCGRIRRHMEGDPTVQSEWITLHSTFALNYAMRSLENQGQWLNLPPIPAAAAGST